MATLIYEHRGCSHEGEQYTVRPDVDGSVFTSSVPRCIETGAQLELVAMER